MGNSFGLTFILISAFLTTSTSAFSSGVLTERRSGTDPTVESSCVAYVAAPPSVADHSKPASDRSQRIAGRFARWIAATTVICGLAVGGTYACRIISDDPTLRAGFFGALLTLAISRTGAELRRFVAPQLNWAGQWLDRLGYAVNHYVLSRVQGREPARGPLGDVHSPDIAQHLWGRMTEQQQETALRLDSLANDFDWMGYGIAQMIRNEHYDDAAGQFVATVARWAYTNEEVLQQSVGISHDPMVREILMMAFRGHFADKMATLAKENPAHVERFEEAVGRALARYSQDYPQVFSRYRTGMQIVVNDWMKELVKKLCDKDWCVSVPVE